MIEATFNRHIKPKLGKNKISKIRTDDIKKLSEELKKTPAIRGVQQKAKADASPLNPRTVKKIISSLRALFNWAIKEGYVDKNTVVVAEIIKTDKNEAGRVLLDAELEKLWNLDEFIVKPRLLLFLKACYHTGARPSGVMTIQVKHINFNKKTIHIRAMKQGNLTMQELVKSYWICLKSGLRNMIYYITIIYSFQYNYIIEQKLMKKK